MPAKAVRKQISDELDKNLKKNNVTFCHFWLENSKMGVLYIYNKKRRGGNVF